MYKSDRLTGDWVGYYSMPVSLDTDMSIYENIFQLSAKW